MSVFYLILTFFAFGMFLGWVSANFFYGRSAYCYECWIALLNGRRYEDGCANCVARCYNDRITH